MIFARVILKILQKFKSMPQLPVLKKRPILTYGGINLPWMLIVDDIRMINKSMQ